MNFHLQFTAEVARQLAPKLCLRYVALTTKYFITDTTEDMAISTPNGKTRSIYSDVGVAEIASWPMSGGSARVAVMEPPLQIATIMPELAPQHVIEIRDVEERRLVTLIEVFSPTNKRGEGYSEYLANRQRVLLSATHLMEIDLLRKGKRVPMRQPLPTVPAPLFPEEEDAALNLQLAFTNVYDAIGYDLLLDYTRAPDAPLEGEMAVWAAALLKNQ
jgi:hypothetical protein